MNTDISRTSRKKAFVCRDFRRHFGFRTQGFRRSEDENAGRETVRVLSANHFQEATKRIKSREDKTRILLVLLYVTWAL